jgi:hypothetical protein
MDWQLMSDGGTIGLAIGGLVPYLIPELEERARKSIRLRVSILVFFVVVGIGVVSFNRIERQKLQTQLDSMPQKVAEYIRNISPPPISPPPMISTAPAQKPPTKAKPATAGDAQLGKHCLELSDSLFAFLHGRGEAPTELAPGEQWLDHIQRVNDWYRNVMDAYFSQFGADVLNTVQQLKKRGLADQQLEFEAEKAVNPLMIRDLALKLGAIGQQLTH